MNRKHFLQNSLMALGAMTMAKAEQWLPSFMDKKETESILILYTNDQHSRIDPFPDNHPQYAGKGGMAARAAVIEELKKQYSHVLIFDSGDIFQGTPYFNFFHGKPELELMSIMGYQSSTFGNHDFDLGIENLVEVLPFANFDFINCNYDFSDTPLAAHKKILNHKIFQAGNLKIGVIGVGIDLEDLVPEKNRKGLRYNDPVTCVNQQAKFLKKEMKCHLVVCLSHLGFSYKNNKISDVVLASESLDVDLILGGHTHTFLEQPHLVKNKHGKPVYVCQVGWAGIWLGMFEIIYSPYKKFFIFANSCREIFAA